ncbi:MAG: hypothetical protein J2P25_05435 [Nocardiopsaceae bacterium]|nr:hypothetical protein [Nocardiopsaceae bacterium]
MREPLLDPTGDAGQETDTTLTARPASLRGATIGLLENTKPNAVPFLRAIARELGDKYGTGEIKVFRKGYFGHPVEESVVNRMLHNCDFAVAGIGD